MLHHSSGLHVVRRIEMYVAQKYNTYNGLAGHVQYSWCVDVLKASFVRVQCDSSQLSISLSQVTVSREKRCCGNKAAPRPSRTLPITRPPRGKTEPELTHDYCVMARGWSGPLYFPSRCLDWHAAGVREHNGSGMTQELWLCWVAVITNLIPVVSSQWKHADPSVYF